MDEKVAVVGLGYVGLPVALAMADAFADTVGFDAKAERVAELRAGVDRNGEVDAATLRASSLLLTADPADLAGATFFVVAVPTPVDVAKRPDLGALLRASRTVGAALRPGAVVVYESTVYPGLTEEICGRELERASGLAAGHDFFLGYSPERINPGDHEHSLPRITKIVSGQDRPTLERVAGVYERIVPAGVHRAPSIRVAEAAKVIENTQRDLNVALMNELAIIFDRLGIRTKDVLAAAGTKWNFLRFSPGLVGGHCIGVDPYYLTSKAEEVGYQPQVILAGRRINDGMGAFVAQRTVKMLARRGVAPAGARVAILGLTFKENVSDLRNSRVPDIVAELAEYGVTPLVHDPLGSPDEAWREYQLRLVGWSAIERLDGMILAVPHRFYADLPRAELLAPLGGRGVLVDVKGMLEPATVPPDIELWSL